MVDVPDGFHAEIVMSGLTFPTSVEFDDSGNLYIAEAGYSYGDETATPRILRVGSEGQTAVLAEGTPLVGPINDLLWHDGRLYVSHRGKISTLQQDGTIRDLVAGLPSEGDHHNNQLSAGPVGLDSAKMGWLKKQPNFHDIPARDIQLTGRTFETANPFETTDQKVSTLPFHPFGKADNGGTVAGQVKASGTILRMNPDGSELEVYAWGLRNPYGLMWSPEGTLFATENGFDVRGSRPIANDKEDIYIIREGAWYGWPDYAMGLPVTDPQFKPKDMSQPQFLMKEHPEVEKPWMNFPKHSAIAKIDFAPSGSVGEGEMFVAFFGHMTPMTGTPPEEHGGHRVLRVDPKTQKSETFFGPKKSHHSGGHSSGEQASGEHGSGEFGQSSGGGHSKPESFTAGPRRLLDVRFAPDGKALYVADFGAMDVQAGAQPVPGTGVIWRVVPEDAKHAGPPANLRDPNAPNPSNPPADD
jgi:glucose/arabinose dehydrogenase